MAYATNADVEERLGTTLYVQLTDDSGTGSADEDKVTEARQAAEAEIDSYVGRRYAVPIDTTGQDELAAMLKSVTLDLAEHRLHARRPPIPDAIRQKRTFAVQWLERAASGQVVLPTAIELAGSGTSGVVGKVTGPARVMSRDELSNL
jgi:phage gp36-like protein